ncbi:MAG: VWA domain-containing protein [Clostridia bacterium]|nr:VWA domain-containing protein [Clostridia bacterium]MDY6183941.1 VWA domain-containing protein [Eubacteriales bacterium]
MCKITVSFERPWAFALILVLGFLIFFPYFRTPKNKRRSAGRIISLVARCCLCVVALVLLSSPSFTEVTSKPRGTSIVLVLDASSSDETLREQMQEYACQLIDDSDSETEFAVVWFAGDHTAVDENAKFTGKENAKRLVTSDTLDTLVTDATDIAGALKYANSLFPDERTKVRRVILLSDGRETVGNAYEAAGALLSNGVRLDAVPFDVAATDYAEVALSDFTVSPTQVIGNGKSLTLTVTIQSSVEVEGSVAFYDGDRLIREINVAPGIGYTTYQQAYTPEVTGSDGIGVHELRAELVLRDGDKRADSLTQNNTLYTWVKINSDAKLLLVDGDGQQATALKPQLQVDYSEEIDVCSPSQFPRTMKDLLVYDEVALLNTRMDALPDGSDLLLYYYVNYVGRGLLTTSGNTTESYESYQSTRLEEMLPLTLTLDETQNNVAIVIVLDDSGSMTQGTDRFTPALEGAKKIINVLSETDYVGLVTFHDTATIQQELVQLDNKDEIIDKINSFDVSKVSQNGGTNYGAGLDNAYDMLRDFDKARSKYVIFLSDGAPTVPASSYEAIPGNLKNRGILLTTISLLADNYAKNLLADMAKNGGGIFKAVDTEEDLEGLSTTMEEMAQKAKEPQFVNEEPFIPKVLDGNTGILIDVADNINFTLNGYIGSTAREEAKMPLFNDDFRPIVAEWAFGNGYVTSLMTNIGSEWGEELYTSEGGYGIQFLRNLFAQSLNHVVQSTGNGITFRQDGETAQIRVETPYRDVSGAYMEIYVDDTGTVTVDEITRRDITASSTLTKVSTGVYRGDFATPEPNDLYYVTVLYRSEDGDILDSTYLGYTGGVKKEYQIFSQDGAELLGGITREGGGAVMGDTASVLSVVLPSTFESSFTLTLPLGVAALVLVMVDLVSRLITFKKKKKDPYAPTIES